jgi:BirA family biotin operon repressor/biotin-[acetyl-CoA-carboxylase] ligase
MLRSLEQAQGMFVPLEALGPDPVAVLHDLNELEAFGFRIERHPYLGTAYRGPSERLCPDQIEHELETKCVGRRIAVWNRVASTNDVAAAAASSLANEGLVVLAEEQFAGRGRRGRTWTAPPRSSLLMSVLLFPTGPLDDNAALTALASLAVAEVVSGCVGREARIKWPNDVRVESKKVAGILVERGAGSVIGIGVNSNIAHDQFTEALRATATSLQILSGRTVDRSELARSLVRRLDALYETARNEGPRALSAAWRERCEPLGRLVRVETPNGTKSGILRALDPFHDLEIRLADGSSVAVPIREVLSISSQDAAGEGM